MSLLAAVALWAFHGVALLWGWGQFRPHIALLHGGVLAALIGGLVWVGWPENLMYIAGAVIGAVAGWGHRLAPGLFVGIGLLWTVPFLRSSPSALLAVAAFALTAQAVAFLVSFTKSSL